MKNAIKLEELKNACKFLDLDFRIYTNGTNEITSCTITYPFEDNPEEEFVVVKDNVIKDHTLAFKIAQLREYRAKMKELQNEIKLLTKNK